MDALLYLGFMAAIVAVMWWVLTNDAKGNAALGDTTDDAQKESGLRRPLADRRAPLPRVDSRYD
jgi:hypothetical protein